MKCNLFWACIEQGRYSWIWFWKLKKRSSQNLKSLQRTGLNFLSNDFYGWCGKLKFDIRPPQPVRPLAIKAARLVLRHLIIGKSRWVWLQETGGRLSRCVWREYISWSRRRYIKASNMDDSLKTSIYDLIKLVHVGSSLLSHLSPIYRQFGLLARYMGE